MVRGKEGAAGWPWCAQRQGRVALYSAAAGTFQYTALVQTQLEAGGGAWGHLVWQGHYLAARQGKSVVAGTHPRIPSNPDGHSRSAQRWQVGNRRGGGAGLQEIIQPNLGPGSSTGAQAVTRSPQHTSQEIQNRAEQDAEETRERALRDVERARDQALQDITAQASRMVIETSSRVIQSSLNEQDHQRLIEESLAEFSASKP